MAKISFRNPEVDAKYEVVGEVDVKKVGFGHHGQISKVSAATAELLLKSQDPHIKLKAAAASAQQK